MLRYVSHPGLIPASQEPSVVKLFTSKVKTKSAEHVSSMASRHSKRERNHCMLSAVPHILYIALHMSSDHSNAPVSLTSVVRVDPYIYCTEKRSFANYDTAPVVTFARIL